MASTILHMNAANIFVGDEDPTKSLHLVIKNVKLPSLEEMTKEHLGGGAAAQIQLGMGAMNALALTFNLEGYTPTVLANFMPGVGRKKYTIRGNIRDVRDHTDTEIKAVIEGRMTKAEMSEFERSKGLDTAYEIREVAFYSLYYGQQEKLYFDYFAGLGGVRVDGVQVFAGAVRNLGLV